MRRGWRVVLALASIGCSAPPASIRHSTTTPPAASPPPTPSVVAPPTPHARCGNGKVEEAETCDDGNTLAGDGCASDCRREPVRFYGWDYALVADGSLVSRKTGQALDWRAALPATDAALVPPDEALRFSDGVAALFPLPNDAHLTKVAGNCVLNDRSEVWCRGTEFTSPGRPHFEPGPSTKEQGVTRIWNKLRHAPGPVIGLAGNFDVGCILLDGGASAQCWGRERRPPWLFLHPKMALGRGRVATQLVGGSEHFCALLANGEVGCWGDSSYGQTGYMAEVAATDRPDLPIWVERRRRTPPATFLKFDSPVKQLVASDVTSCVLLKNGKLWCWGDTDTFAFENPNEPTFQERMESKQPDSSGGHMPKPLGASTLPGSPIKLPSACTAKDFSLVSGQLCVTCEGGCGNCWGRSPSTLNVTKAEPPAACLTF